MYACLHIAEAPALWSTGRPGSTDLAGKCAASAKSNEYATAVQVRDASEGPFQGDHSVLVVPGFNREFRNDAFWHSERCLHAGGRQTFLKQFRSRGLDFSAMTGQLFWAYACGMAHLLAEDVKAF